MFFVGKKPRLNKTHIIHQQSCDLLPDETNTVHLREATNATIALQEAQKHYKKVKLCPICNPDFPDANVLMITAETSSENEAIQ